MLHIGGTCLFIAKYNYAMSLSYYMHFLYYLICTCICIIFECQACLFL